MMKNARPANTKNQEEGIYRLNHNEENDKLFKECLEYGDSEDD